MTGERKSELDKDALEKARMAFTVHLRKAGAFDTTIGECKVHLFRAAMHDAITAYLTALPQSALSSRLEMLERLDREAATHVESVICMRTHFTGDPPYVGWKGLGLALNEALDERDRLREAAAALGGIPEGWRTIDSAPKDGTPVLLQLRSDLPVRSEDFNGLQFVGRNTNDLMFWAFAAPVGMGGFPDEWFIGWKPLTPAAPLTPGEQK